MKFALKSGIILLLILMYAASFGQTGSKAHQNDFEWHYKKECWPKNAVLEIFKVVETPPLVIGIEQKKFKSDIQEILKNNAQFSAKEMEIKIQIYTLVDYGVCVGGILASRGTDKELIKKLLDYAENLDHINPGKQRGIEKNCQSEIFIKTKKNKLKEIKFSNLKIAK